MVKCIISVQYVSQHVSNNVFNYIEVVYPKMHIMPREANSFFKTFCCICNLDIVVKAITIFVVLQQLDKPPLVMCFLFTLLDQITLCKKNQLIQSSSVGHFNSANYYTVASCQLPVFFSSSSALIVKHLSLKAGHKLFFRQCNYFSSFRERWH